MFEKTFIDRSDDVVSHTLNPPRVFKTIPIVSAKTRFNNSLVAFFAEEN